MDLLNSGRNSTRGFRNASVSGWKSAAIGCRSSLVRSAFPVFSKRGKTDEETYETGFFGVVPGSLLAQVGRGYSDLCAALCAVGTRASELQVWKEVDGIFTADPRKVPTARLLSTITPEEAAELTYYGSEVIHPFTMEQVIRAAIPIRIKNVENPKGEGTIIFPDAVGPTSDEPAEGRSAKDAIAPSTAPSIPSSLSSSALEPHLGPTAITIKDTVVVLSVHSNRKTISHGFFARIFGILDKYGIVVDLISTSEVHVSMAIHGEMRKGTMERVARDLKVVGEVRLCFRLFSFSLPTLILLTSFLLSLPTNRSPSRATWLSFLSSAST
jgi:aspartate kinase